MNFGLNLINARERLNLTQKQLSEIAGIRQNTISNYENNKTTPSISNVKILADALKIDTNELIKK